MEDLAAKVVELVQGDEQQTPAVEVFKTATERGKAASIQCAVPWVDVSQGMVDLSVNEQTAVVTKAEPNGTMAQIVTTTAPYHAYLYGEGPVPVFDTHRVRSPASECLAERLMAAYNSKPDDGTVVALAMKDEGAVGWSEHLTEVLLKMGAKFVPPQYRASWVFLWTPAECFEFYRRQSKGMAAVRVTLNGRLYELESAGFRDGNFAQIKVDGVAQLRYPRTGVNCCIWGSNREVLLDRRCFQHESDLTSHLSQVQSGSRCVVICIGAQNESPQGFHRALSDELIRLGGSGRTIGPFDSYALAGTMRASPILNRGKLSSERICSALQAESRLRGFAFVSLLFGDQPGMCLGALVLGRSLQNHSPDIPRILLISLDISPHIRQLLQANGWQLRDVPYIRGAYSHFKEGARFPPEIFMKLHIFNPDALPYHKVLFLDLDTFVRKDLRPVFDFPTPAAVNNWKGGDKKELIKEREIMDPQRPSVNAGVLLVSPSAALFQVMREEAETPASHHSMHWCPEQAFISTVLLGHMRHLHCRYNFECLIHGGTWCSEEWQKCEIDDIHIVHFSGQHPWEVSSHDEVTCVVKRGWSPDRRKYRLLESEHCRKLASRRSHLFHEEWFKLFGELDFLQDDSLDDDTAEGIIPLTRMTAFLQRLQTSAS